MKKQILLTMLLAWTMPFFLKAQCTPPDLTVEIRPGFEFTTFLSCNNATLILEANSLSIGTTFQWVKQPNTTTIISTFQTLTISEIGTYTVTGIALDGCKATASINVIKDLTPPANLNVIAACGGNTTALVASSSTSGTTFQWTGATAFATNPVTIAGTYTVTAKHPMTGCTTSLSTIFDPAIPLLTGISGSLSLCATGKTTLTATGGLPTDAYLWFKDGVIIPNIITQSLEVTQAGKYAVRITGAGGCMGIKEVTVTGGGPAINLGNDIAICSGTTTITAAPTGGTTPYGYKWSNNATIQSISVGAGTYSVTVTDANQCTATDEIKVTAGNGLLPPYVGTGIFCGCANVVAKARRQPAVVGTFFVWYDNPNRTGTPLSTQMSPEGDVGLLPSTTSKTVWAFEKLGDCYSEGSQVILTVFPIPTMTPSVPQTDIIACGSATISATPSKIGTLLEWWSTPNQTLGTKVADGATYTTTITQTLYVHEVKSESCGSGDILKCYGPPVTINVTINPVPQVIAGPDIAICNGVSTILTATPIGGTAPYAYKWSNNATTASITVATPNTYSVELTDKNNCKATDDVIVKSGAGFSFTFTKTDIKCYGDRTAKIVITPSISGSFKYSRDGGLNFQTSNIFDNLSAKKHVIVVKLVGSDCVSTQEIEITQPKEFEPTNKLKQISCHDANDGWIEITPVGGTAPYQYKMNGGSFQSNNTFGNLSAGFYTIQTKDANGCTYNFNTLKIVNPDVFKLTLDGVEQLRCNGYKDAHIYTRTWGGSGLEKYTVNNGATWQKSSNFGDLGAGTYIVFARDASGCFSNKETVVIKEPAPISYTTTKTDASCNGDDGKITFNLPTGGTAPYSYSVDECDFKASATFSNLKSGTHIVRVRDSKGCLSVKQSVKIEKSSAPTFSIEKYDITCGYSSNGIIAVVSVKGGLAPYKYSCDNGRTYQFSNSFTGNPAGTYSIVVKDSKGCISETVKVEIVNKCPYKNNNGNLVQAKPTQGLPVVMWQVTPNPAIDVVQIQVTSLSAREQEFVFFNMQGQPIKREKRSLVKGEQNIWFDCTEMQSGFYQIVTPGSISHYLAMRFLKM